MTYLLDVNVLVVLHQSRHTDFSTVQHWFEMRPRLSFATCPITQLAMVRILMRQLPDLDQFRVDEAREALRRLTSRPGHEFWSDEPQYLDATNTVVKRMQGHRQTTDAYLLGLAVFNKGKLATLDRGIVYLAGNEYSGHVELIEPGTKSRGRQL